MRWLQASDAPLYASLYTSPEVLAHVGQPMETAATRRQFERVLALTWAATFQHRCWVLQAPGGQAVGIATLNGSQDRGAARLSAPWIGGAAVARLPRWHRANSG